MTVYENSFLHFVYPFRFDATSFDRLVKAIEQAEWKGRTSPLEVWERQPFTDLQEDLLPHVARYLNSPDGTPATARLWNLSRDALQSTNGGLGNGGDWRMVTPAREIPFRLEAVQLTLFRVGVGLLTVRAHPVGAEVSDWLDFLHYFRFVRGQRRVSLKIQQRVGIDPQTRQPQFSPFFPEPTGGTAEHPDGDGNFGEILQALLQTGIETADEPEQWWGEVFVPGQMLPFAALYVDAVPEDGTAHLLYRVRNFFHARQELHPAPQDLRPDHPALLPYAERQWFLFSLDGGAFVACDTPDTPFFRQTMPAHLRDQYFLLFLLALHQRFGLIALSEDVASHWLVGDEKSSDDKREAVFRRIRDALLSFTARGNFTQVMQREHHHRCYRKWRETFQVEALYQEVSAEVQEMHNYLLIRRTEQLRQLAEADAHAEAERERAAQQRTQRLERLITLLGVFIAAFGITLGFLGINLQGYTADEGLTLKWALLVGVGGGAVLGVILSLVVLVTTWLLRRKSRGED